MKRRSITFSSALWVAVLGTMNALAHDPPPGGCGTFSGDVAHEMAVMQSPAVSMTAESSKEGQAPRLSLDQHYAISLTAQNHLRFRVKPGRATRANAARGGVFQFQVPAVGRYRVSITSRHWIDLLDGDSVLESVNHHGPGCDLLHKIVEFDLAAGRSFTLQLSAQEDAIIGLAITASPSTPTQSRT